MRLGGWKLPLERLSATSLSTYVQCPEQFRHKYLLNEKEKMSGERFVGSVTHQSLQALFGPERFQTVANSITVAEVVDECWQSVIEREGEPEWHDVDATEQYRRTKQMVQTYWPIASSTVPVAVEQRFEESILGVTISGYLDLELENRIREVKTSSRKESKPKSRWRFQGRLYSLVSMKPIEWHVVTRQATPQVVTPAEAPGLEATYGRDATVLIIKHAIERMNDDYARYGAKEPWPMDGIFGDWACDYCSFKKGCPAWL